MTRFSWFLVFAALFALGCGESASVSSGETGSESASAVEEGGEADEGGAESSTDLCSDKDCDDGNPCTDDSCDEVTGDCLNESVPDRTCDDGNACSTDDVCGDTGVCAGASSLLCDDGEACTNDLCDEVTGCVFEAVADGETCNDGDSCTLVDACKDGVCAGTAKPCPDDDNPCTAGGGCDEKTGECLFIDVPDETLCDDGNECTAQDMCMGGECLSEQDTVCDDGNPCTDDGCTPKSGCTFYPNQEFCDDDSLCTTNDKCLQGQCKGAVLECDDGNECTNDGCDPETGCVHESVDVPCEDGNLCTLNDQCEDGQCQNGPKKDCDDDDPCTDQKCDLATGNCSYNYNEKPCEDGNLCTQTDLCSGGECEGAPVDCDDGNQCTNDGCSPDTGCTYESIDNKPCDDGNACSSGDTCVDGQCTAGGVTLCDDDNPCTTDTCDEGTGCVFTDNEDACDDGDACTTEDICAEGNCVGGAAPDCNDGNLCTDDVCDEESGCVSTNNAAVCDDGDACTTGDVCAEGVCGGIDTSAEDCDDDNVCTTDGCTADTGCVNPANSSACDDGDACTTADTCDQTLCIGGAAPDCDDGNVCTDDACDSGTGCTHTPNAVACDDGDACTTGDVCADGSCGGVDSLVCDDGNVCTDDTCEGDKGCVFTANAVACDDGDACTVGDGCVETACISGAEALDCDDGELCTNDSCNPVEGCVYSANDLACDDGDACTLGDTCGGGACQPGLGALNCDDGNACTNDSCSPGDGCLNLNQAVGCEDGNPCTESDYCLGGVCTSGNNACGCEVDADCGAEEDGNLCNGTLFCDQSSFPYSCQVAAETVVVCDASGDTSCESNQCDGATGTCAMSPINPGGPCEDGNLCTQADTCADGACESGMEANCDDDNVCTNDSCDEATGACVNAANDLACDDGNACTAGDACLETACLGAPIPCEDGDACTSTNCEPATGCTYGGLTGPACDDENACTNGDTCLSGACGGTAVSCDDDNPCTDDSCDPQNGCVNSANTVACNDGDACTGNDTCAAKVCVGGAALSCEDGNVCTDDSCDPSSGCLNAANTNPCDDGNACTVDDVCQATVCQPGPAADCDDDNFCTSDVCSFIIGCENVPNAVGCNDGNACTTGDTCSAGNCVGGLGPNCDDGNVCTDDSCEPDSGCINAANVQACDDDDACTVGDVCAASACNSGADANCDDNDACTADSCDAETGCVNIDISGACDDGYVCTVDTCDAATGCVHTPDDGACASGETCITDTCDVNAGCISDITPDCCGNGIIEGAELCDDNNTLNGDGCGNDCSLSCSSIEFDGNSTYVSVPDSAEFTLGSGDFTIELYANLSPTSLEYFVGQNGASCEGNTGPQKWIFGYGPNPSQSAMNLWFHIQPDNEWLLNYPVDIPLGEWVHLAVTRQGDTFRLFLDGEWVATDTYSGSIPDIDGPFTIGNSECGGYFDGAMDQVRLSSTAHYLSDFTPPAALTDDSEVIGLWQFSETAGSEVFDSSGNGHHGTLNNGSWSDEGYVCNPESPCGDGVLESWEACDDGNTINGDGCSNTCELTCDATECAGSSLSFGGNADRIVVPQSSDFDIWDADFTIEAWVRPESYGSGVHSIVSNRNQSAPGMTFNVNNGSLGIGVNGQEGSSGITWDWTIGPGPAVGQWSHVAVVRNGNTVTYFENGQELATTNSVPDFPSVGGNLYIGNRQTWEIPAQTGPQPWSGEISRVRMSNMARYQADFCPSTVWTPDESTMGLWTLDEGSGTQTLDSSGNGHHGVITDAQWGSDDICGWEFCGNGITEGGEDCDDGNTLDGDGCDSTCSTESCDTFIFESMQSGTTTNLGGVWGTSGSNVYAVGKDGIILHYDGQGWTPMTSNTSSTLTSIWGVGPDDIYAVGQTDLLHFDGTGWTSQGPGIPVARIDVWGADKDNVYLVGWEWTINKGSLDNWTSVNIGIPKPGTEANQLNGVYGFGADSIYAVGVGGSILHYNGTSWLKAESGTSEHLNSVWGTGTNDVFVGGEGGTLLHYDGSSWSSMPNNVVGTVQGLYGISATNVYVVGDPDSYTEGFIAHYDGTSWSDVAAPDAPRLEDIWITPNGSEAFAVGYDGTIMHGYCPESAICGNGDEEGDEQCDDGNTLDGDGCDSTCIVEVVEGWQDVDSENLSGEIPAICAIDPGGQIHCWSEGSDPMVENPPQGSFTALSLAEKANDGVSTACAIDDVGSITCWPEAPGSGEIPIPTDGPFDSIDCGLDFCCATRLNDTIACWGSDQGYQGQGQSTEYPSGPGQMEVGAGVYDACALDSEGYLSCWGKGGQGAHNVPSGGNHIAVAAGYYSGCALDESGTPICWGLAAGTEPDQSGFNRLFGHRHIFCALTPQGDITCWYSDGTTSSLVGSPPADTKFTNLGLGLYQMCGITISGSVMCWGDVPNNMPSLGMCGDSVIDFGEECDDGNLVDGDGCSNDCTVNSCASVNFPKSLGIEIDDHPDLKFENAFSFAAWVVPEDAGTERMVLSKPRKTGGTGLWMKASQTGAAAGFCGPSGCTPNCGVSSVSSLPANSWTHVGATWNGSDLKIYINGELESAGTCEGTPGSVNDTPFLIGLEWPGAGDDRSYYGDIGEVIAWNTAVSSTEMENVFTGIAPQSPIAHWKMDEGSGSMAYDSSGNGHHGVMDSGLSWNNDWCPWPF